MQSALFSMFVLGGVAAVIVGGLIAFFAVRSAPEGFEDENGFHAVAPSTASKAAGGFTSADELEMVA